MSEEIVKPGDPNQGYDRHDARAGLVFFWAIVTVVFLVVSVGVMNYLATTVTEVEYTELQGKRLWEESRDVHAREEEQLHHYGYIEKEKGVVRLPIDRAMQLVEAEYKDGKTSYNTKSYPVKVEPLGGAAAPPVAAVMETNAPPAPKK